MFNMSEYSSFGGIIIFNIKTHGVWLIRGISDLYVYLIHPFYA
jgi:hypothetical protein